jgi:antitoxin component YwqK of YwqJK toxin-antitoxin module
MLRRLNNFILIVLILLALETFSQNDTIIERIESPNNKIVEQGKLSREGTKTGNWIELVYHNDFVTYINKVSYYSQNKFVLESHDIDLQLKIKYYGYLDSKGNKVLSGRYYAYGNSGKVMWMVEYKDDKMKGQYKEYNSTSKLIVESIKVNGNFNGEYKNYYGSGKIKSIGTFLNGEKIGFWKYYREGEDLYAEGSYSKGYHLVYVNDKEIVFKDSKDEVVIKRIKSKEEQLKCLKNEDLCCVYPVKKYFKDGIWKYYDSSGKLVKEEEWNNGKLEEK